MKIYTDEEIQLIKDVSLPATEIADRLNISPVTVYRKRKELGVLVPRGTKTGPNLKLRKRITKQCIGKDCNNTFEATPNDKKKYCSHSCQARTQHIAPKGIGSRSIRNPNVKEYRKYSRLVHGLSQETYLKHIDIINPNRYPRTLCGVENGWQLDHIISIKECFEKNIPPEQASSVENLRMLPWKENLMRNFNDIKNSQSDD